MLLMKCINTIGPNLKIHLVVHAPSAAYQRRTHGKAQEALHKERPALVVNNAAPSCIFILYLWDTYDEFHSHVIMRRLITTPSNKRGDEGRRPLLASHLDARVTVNQQEVM